MHAIREIRKRDRRVVPFEPGKIAEAIDRALAAGGEHPEAGLAERLAGRVRHTLGERFGGDVPSIDDVRGAVEETLLEAGRSRAARAYSRYRERRDVLRGRLEVRKDRSCEEPPPESPWVEREPPAAARGPEEDTGGLVTPGPWAAYPAVEAEGTAAWSREKIVAALVREADLDLRTAEDVASSVERKVLHSGCRRISTSLVRELVDNELFERRIHAKLRRQQPIGLPRYDLERIVFGCDRRGGGAFPRTPAEIHEAIAHRILHRYALREVHSPEVADAHRDGRVFVHRLSDPIRPARVRWELPPAAGARREGAALADAAERGVPGGGWLDGGDLSRKVAWWRESVSEELRLARLESVLTDPLHAGRRAEEAAAAAIEAFAAAEGGARTVLEVPLGREGLPWLAALAGSAPQGMRGLRVAVRSAPASRDEAREAALFAARLVARGERLELLPPAPAGVRQAPGAACVVAKATINLPRAAYRARYDPGRDVDGELDAACDLAVKALLERRAFALRLADGPGLPLRDLFGGSGGPPGALRMDRDAVFAVGVLGLDDAVRCLTGRSLHEDAEAREAGRRILDRLAAKLRREARGLGLRLRLEETRNTGPLRELEASDRRLYPPGSGRDGPDAGYADGVRPARLAPLDPLRRLEVLAPLLAVRVEPEGGVIEGLPELERGEEELLAGLLVEAAGLLERVADGRIPGAVGAAPGPGG